MTAGSGAPLAPKSARMGPSLPSVISAGWKHFAVALSGIRPAVRVDRRELSRIRSSRASEGPVLPITRIGSWSAWSRAAKQSTPPAIADSSLDKLEEFTLDATRKAKG